MLRTTCPRLLVAVCVTLLAACSADADDPGSGSAAVSNQEPSGSGDRDAAKIATLEAGAFKLKVKEVRQGNEIATTAQNTIAFPLGDDRGPIRCRVGTNDPKGSFAGRLIHDGALHPFVAAAPLVDTRDKHTELVIRVENPERSSHITDIRCEPEDGGLLSKPTAADLTLGQLKAIAQSGADFEIVD